MKRAGTEIWNEQKTGKKERKEERKKERKKATAIIKNKEQ